MKVMKDLTNSPDDNHRYSMNIIRKVNKVSEHVVLHNDQHILTFFKDINVV